MAVPVTKCPADRDLQEFLVGQESDDTQQPDAQRHVAEHIDSCDDCQQRLGELVSEPDWQRLVNSKPSPFSSAAVATIWVANDRTVPQSTEDPATLLPQIPGFDVLSKIGNGGMSTVYQARQISVNRIVALKLLSGNFETQLERLLRFRREAEAVGRLQHHAIVPVFEYGEHEGRPFIVQEFADGGTLETKTEAVPQSPERTVDWMVHVTDAVQHAHEQGVLHRDIKPSNILFGGNQVKLADFGLAKFVDVEDKLTQTEAVFGTPAYMSPEQSLGRQDEIGPTTDVFSLGVVLYELLTGISPFRAGTPVESLRLVQEHDPVAPRQLQPAVPRDLNTICLKCLQKQPSERYASGAGLLSDLQRFQAGEPILAKPLSAPMKIWRWLRRHPTTASILTLTSTAAAAGIVLWIMFTNRLQVVNDELIDSNNLLQEEKDNVEEQKAEVERQAASLTAVRSFLTDDLLGQAHPEYQIETLKALGLKPKDFERDPKLSTIVARSIRRLEGRGLERRFPSQPEVQAEVLKMLGAIEFALKRNDSAVTLLERAIAVHAEDEVPSREERSMWNLLCLALISEGQHEKAIERLLWVLKHERADGTVQMQATVEHNLAGAYMMSDQTDLALEHVTNAVNNGRQSYGIDDPQTLAFEATMAQVLKDKGRIDEAVTLLKKVVAGFEKTRGDKHPRTISSLSKLAIVERGAGNTEDALAHARRAYLLGAEVLGPTNPSTMHYRRELVRCLIDAKIRPEATVHADAVFEYYESKFPADHIEVTDSAALRKQAEALPADE